MQTEQVTPSVWELFKITLLEWNADNAAHLAAALAYYTVFSIAPLVIVGVGLTSIFLGREAAQGELVEVVSSLTNSAEAVSFVQTIMDSTFPLNNNLLAPLIGFLILLYGATGVFVELKQALNLIWDVPQVPNPGIWQMVLGRLLSLAMVLLSGFLILISLIMTTVLAAAADWLDDRWAGMGSLSQIGNFIFFFVVTVLIFALTYKYVPDVRIAWSDVWLGAVSTALLFSIGRLLLSIYLSQSTVVTAYGAAGSLIVILLWIYYSAQIFFLGAEFTQVFGRTYGSRQREHPLLDESEPEAEPVTEEGADTIVVPAPTSHPQRRRWRQTVLRPAANIALALGIISVIAIYNFAREPFRK